MLRISGLLALALSLILSPSASAKDKHKAPLSADILKAETAWVTIHPDAGEPLTGLSANRRAREAVERALTKWSSPTDDRPVVVQPSDNGNIRIGGQHGRPPDLSQPIPGQDNSPHVSTEVGSSNDTLEVYRGREEQPALDTSPVWRYSAKDALRAPTVSAVEQFQKAIAEAEKAANSKPTQLAP